MCATTQRLAPGAWWARLPLPLEGRPDGSGSLQVDALALVANYLTPERAASPVCSSSSG